ncbi:glycosyltransferase family 4 protein [Coprobacter sp.]|uniref:glycosyltransferase family 4 protein n=1 Tax=Coprobacter sp. TaxID=1941478 RepID=UPI003AB40A9C
MKVCLYTIDMYAGTERLMPWRTLVEVAKYMREYSKITISVCSGQDKDFRNREYDSVTIHSIKKGIPALVSYLQRNETDVLFYPVAFRDVFKPLEQLQCIKAQKIAYIPGGIYPLNGIIALGKVIGIKNAKPYILEKIIPHSWLVSKMKRKGFSYIISFSDITKQNVVKCGWSSSYALSTIPGLDNFNRLESDYFYLDKLNLQNKKFILFSGAPATIRGSIMLLKAFDLFAEQEKTMGLVMLMRQDLSSDFTLFKQALNGMKNSHRVIVSYEKLSPQQLKAFFESAYVVALPFLLIPSEIPLTYFEVLSCGTPIITFKNGGSTEYIKNAAVVISNRTPRALSSGLDKICRNSQYRDELAKQAIELMKNHHSWKEFAKQWITTIENLAV